MIRFQTTAMTTLTATALARNFSDYLNQVRYQGASFDVQRGAEIVARLVPPLPSGGCPIEKLPQLLTRAWATLSDEELAEFAQDLAQTKAQLSPADDPWAY